MWGTQTQNTINDETEIKRVNKTTIVDKPARRFFAQCLAQSQRGIVDRERLVDERLHAEQMHHSLILSYWKDHSIVG